MDPNIFVSPATESVFKFGENLVTRHLGYFYNYNGKFEEVKHRVEMLDDTRKRVQNDVMVAEMNAEEIEEDVKHWLKHVDEKIKEYENFLCDKRHEKTRCSIGFFPSNLQLRYRLGRKATKIVEQIIADELLNKKFDKVSYHTGPSMDAALSNTGYESFMSRKKIMGMIMQALEDSTISMIGIYGVGGVGKTTLVKEVAKQAKERKLFNKVVMANITRNPDIKKVQGQIAEMLGMRLEEESEIVRADRIRKRLKKEKENTLIILDDLWNGLDLNRLGIQRNEDDGVSQKVAKDVADFGYKKVETEKLSADSNKMKKEKLSSDYNKMKKEKLSVDHKGFKIFLTSRNKEVLCNQMDVQERSIFPLGVLDQKEGEALLKKMAEISVTNSAFDDKVTEIAKMCAGLPIALISIGKTLKNKSPYVWEDVCRQIERQNFTGGQEPIEFSAKLSYDHLKTEELKHIFLQCARMGSDFSIMDLVKFCIGLDMLQGVYTIRETKSRVNVLMEELTESSLLVRSYSNDCFNMHDIVRDVALSISSKEKHVFFMKNGKLNEWPHKDKLERYTALVLHYCDIVELPESKYCSRLEVFHIDSKDDLLKIPDDLFEYIIELKVLILTGIDLSFLPSSITCLKNLKMLCLERCTLRDNLSIMGELKKLRILSLSGSNIEVLPVELGQLDKLQLLDLSNCSQLRVIPSNMILGLNNLEEFYMRDDLILRETNEETQSKNASLSELRHLKQLRGLDIHIPSVAHFPQNLFFDKLDSYKIIIGEINMLSVGEFKIPDKYEAVKFLALNLKDGINIHSEKWIKMLFKRVEYLLLGELNDVHDVFYELNVEGFPNLKHLFIVNNVGLLYIINSMKRFHPLLAFSKLESMCLYKLENLEKICDNQLTEASFCRLKIIKIKTCGQLESIFSFFMLSRLTMLETIEVCDCDSLKEIVYVERESDTVSDVQTNKIEFPQLRFLTLQYLPAFFCLYTNDKMPSMSESSEDQVQNRDLKEITAVAGQDTNACFSLFNGKVAMPKLEFLELSSINILQIWNEKSLYCFQSLVTLNVSDCGNLKYLLSLSMSESLVNLQSLFISGCELMEDIFCADDAMQNIDILPKLKKMEINCMEKLSTLWPPYIGFHSFHSLDSLIIRECNKLETIFSSQTGEGFQSLQSLVITNCMSVETIFDFGNISQTCGTNVTNLHSVFLKGLPKLVHIWKVDTDEILNFSNLQSIVVYESKILKYLFPLSVAKGLEKLETLDVCNCWEMEEVVACDYQSNENLITFRFPQLNTLSLQHLFELRSFHLGPHDIEWPFLKKLFILFCSKLEESTNLQVKSIFLATEKVIHNLEYMSISLKEAEWLRDYIFSVHRMHKLQSLVLSGLENTEILFWLLHRLPNLESITLKNCLFEGVWASKSLAAHEKVGVVVQLKELIIDNLRYLQNIGFEHDLLLQRVERLVISECLKLKSLLPFSVSFSYLTYLEVTNCSGLRNLITSSTAMTLVQLTIMKVSLCQGIEKIVAEEEKTQVIEFRHLKAIELVSLPSLTCFCSSEKCDLKFPSLENLVVSDCLLMETFSEVQSAPNLRKIHVLVGEKDRWYWEGDLNSTLQKLSTDKVSFKHSKHLTITEDSELEEIWHSKAAFQDNYFHSLKTLVVMDITKDHAIPSQVLPCLKNLEELEVESCGAVEVIFDVNDIDKKKKGTVARLKKLTLTMLPNLSRVWKKNPQGIVSFPNLQEVSVFDCGQLASLFPSSLAINLLKLQTLEIQWCDNLVEIVEKEDATELGTAQMFKFPCLFSLLLYNLPLLTCFYPGKHRLECHMLDVLDVSYCPMLKLFTSKFHDSYKEAVTESQVSSITTTWHQQPLFSVEEVVPKLKELTVNKESMILLSLAHLPHCKLNLLQLCFEDENNKKDNFPFHFLHKVPSLEHLQVYECFGLMEIFPSQTLQYHERILVRLRKLTLNNLPELDTIGLEHSWIKPYTKKLEFLKLEECPRLEKLVSNVVSFSNLKQLAVESCEEMKNLFTFSTAKSLVQLEILTVLHCKSMKEIVKNEDEAYEEIILGRLKTLKLNFLSRLVSFYSGNAMLQLPCLSTVTIVKCPKMKTFSEGVLNAPWFSGIKTSLNESDFHFHNDLNSTVQWLHQHVSVEHSKHVTVADDSKLEKILHSKAAFQDNNFRSLKSLVVEKVTKDHVIPSQVLPCLKSLEELQVKSCNAVGIIFDVNDIDTKKKGIVSRLKKLTLDTLPSLKCLWNKNPQGIVSFPNLQEVYVSNCGELAALFPSSLARNLVKLEELHIENCDKLVDIVGKDDEIEHETTEMFKFPCLFFLILFGLPLLSCFYPGKHHLVCPLLESLDVSYCPKLKLFTSEFHDSHKESVIEIEVSSTSTISRVQQPLFLIEKVVPKLKELTVNEESILLLSHAHLPQDLLCKLDLLQLCFEDENNKKDTFPFHFLRKVPNLEHLKLLGYSGLTEIFPSKKLKFHDKILSRLKLLTLDNLEELKSIGLEHPWVKPYSERLESLELIECPQVEKLLSGEVSFMNMKWLHVTDCKGMKYLFTFSVAKSLVQLVDLSIQNCESIKEIVRKENEDDSHEIIFGWVKTLNLDSLPLLESFYSGNATLQFSRLKKVTISKCPNMNTFSQGDINAPFFCGVGSSIGDFDLTFHNDLNTTIKNLCPKQVKRDSAMESTDRGSSDGDNYASE